MFFFFLGYVCTYFSGSTSRNACWARDYNIECSSTVSSAWDLFLGRRSHLLAQIAIAWNLSNKWSPPENIKKPDEWKQLGTRDGWEGKPFPKDICKRCFCWLRCASASATCEKAQEDGRYYSIPTHSTTTRRRPTQCAKSRRVLPRRIRMPPPPPSPLRVERNQISIRPK